MRKVKQPEAVDTSKIFIDKSGTEKSNLDPVLQRIRDIHIKEPITPQTFLQPIPPNLERVPEIQKKQIPYDAEKIRVELEKLTLEELKKAVLLDQKFNIDEKSKLKDIISKLPDESDLQLLKGLYNLNPNTIIRAMRNKARIIQGKEKAKQSEKKEEVKSRLNDIDALIKKANDIHKKIIPKKTDEKGRLVPNK